MALASKFSQKPTDHQVLFEGNSNAKTIVLNRPEKLNALTYSMIFQILRNLAAYKQDPNIKIVILKANGKAFCVGGDAAAIASICTQVHWTFGATYFRNVLNLAYMSASFPKPLVSLFNGAVMGAGAGIAMGGKFRIITEKTVFAMPEASLGYYPDVGASYFLSRLPHFIGEYIGLTGVRLDGMEMLACGLATHFVFSANLPLLEEALHGVDSSDEATISKIINGFSDKASLKQGSPILSLNVLSKCFSKETVEDILFALPGEKVLISAWGGFLARECQLYSTLHLLHTYGENARVDIHEQEVGDGEEEWICKAIKSMNLAPPTSLKLFLKSMKVGRTQNISECLIREFRISCHVVRRTINGDFFEGCRAKFVDKDKRHKWEPSKLELVTDAMVNQYFDKICDEDWEDLKLPPVNIGLGVAKL